MSSGEDTVRMLKFTPFVSCVHHTFWGRLSQLKLEVDMLKETEHQVWGYYSNVAKQKLDQVFTIDASSLNEQPDGNRLFGCGKILNKNTIEGFREVSEVEILKNEGKSFLEIIKHSAVENPALLNRFMIVSFADLKKNVFHYKCLFLAPSFISYNQIGDVKLLKDELSESQQSELWDGYSQLSIENREFFLVKMSEGCVEVMTVKEGLSKIQSSCDWFFGVADSCNLSNPGWPLRNFLAFISYHCKEIIQSPIKLLCLRLDFTSKWKIGNSMVLTVKVNSSETVWEREPSSRDWVGWERNEKGQIATKRADLSAFMDPLKVVESAVNLNLKLMKWQILPDLNLDIVQNTKCLLLGAGTLGCSVARNLLSWGVKKISFVDYGSVSLSNPVRQSLFKFKDAGSSKAKTAAAALKEIYPNVEAMGWEFCIPMPGHPVGKSLADSTVKNIQLLEELIDDHDVIFLLMDSRESRWLPTLISAAKSKLVINAALGFDSFLVMRHGFKSDDAEGSDSMLMGSKLGCYFCNEVTAPGDSSKFRTLDQQCTVTRPGVSSIAAGLAVELFVSILQHPLKALAPAESDPDADAAGLLGIVPHSVRGFISNYHIILPATEAFASCVACSPKVVNEYRENGVNFLLKAIESREYLEKLCGLQQLLEEPVMSEVLECSDGESEG